MRVKLAMRRACLLDIEATPWCSDILLLYLNILMLLFHKFGVNQLVELTYTNQSSQEVAVAADWEGLELRQYLGPSMYLASLTH